MWPTVSHSYPACLSAWVDCTRKLWVQTNPSFFKLPLCPVCVTALRNVTNSRQRMWGWNVERTPCVCILIAQGGPQETLPRNRSIVPILSPFSVQSALFAKAVIDTWAKKPLNVHHYHGLARIHYWLNLSFLSYSGMSKCEKVSMPELNLRLLYVSAHLFVFKISNKCNRK